MTDSQPAIDLGVHSVVGTFSTEIDAGCALLARARHLRNSMVLQRISNTNRQQILIKVTS